MTKHSPQKPLQTNPAQVPLKAWEYYELHQEMIRVEQQQQQLEAEQRELEAEKAKYNDPKAVEQAAREQLGLVKPNEVPYIR